MERKGKQKKTARNVIIILCVILVAVSIPVIMALRKSHSQPTPAETTPTPTAPPAEETVSATPSIELPPYGGYSFDNDEQAAADTVADKFTVGQLHQLVVVKRIAAIRA